MKGVPLSWGLPIALRVGWHLRLDQMCSTRERNFCLWGTAFALSPDRKINFMAVNPWIISNQAIWFCPWAVDEHFVDEHLVSPWKTFRWRTKFPVSGGADQWSFDILWYIIRFIVLPQLKKLDKLLIGWLLGRLWPWTKWFGSMSERIHTSWRSESSYICLVV